MRERGCSRDPGGRPGAALSAGQWRSVPGERRNRCMAETLYIHL